MHERIARMRLMVLIVLTALGGIVWLGPTAGAVGGATDALFVHVLDVGQGDAILVETPDGVQVLIDGGRDSGVLRALGAVLPVHDRSIDMVVATHPDADHVGGLVDVLERYTVGSILMTENTGESAAADAYERAVLREEAEVLYARRGHMFALGASTTMRVLFPDTDPHGMESNTASIVLQIVYGDSTFLLTGDSPKSIEEYLVLIEGEQLVSDVLKVGHHGSRTSTSELFLSHVLPTYAIISAGRDNQYGHPHVEVTDLLFNYGVETMSTAEAGTITLKTDGAQVWIE